MTPESQEEIAQAANARPQQAIWPWLLMPLVMLAMFYTLHSFRRLPAPAAAGPAPAEAVTDHNLAAYESAP